MQTTYHCKPHNKNNEYLSIWVYKSRHWVINCTKMEIDAIIVAVVIGLYLWYTYYHKHSRLPPGPRGVPIVGYLPFFHGGKTHEILAKLGQSYGGLFTVYFGSRPVLVLNDWATIKEVLVKEGAVFSSRPYLFLFQQIFMGKDIAFSEGSVWKQLRSFSMSNLKDFGFGRSVIEDSIVQEAEKVIESLLERQGKRIRIAKEFSIAFLNITWQIATGNKFNHDDPQLKCLLLKVNDMIDSMSSGSVLNFFPLLRHIFLRARYSRVCESNNKVTELVKEEVQRHKRSLNKSEIRDFIDVFLVEIEKRGDRKPPFDEEHLVGAIRDLFFAGQETTDTSLSWMLLYISTKPKIQAKVHEELDRVIGSQRLPTFADRLNMPYTMAFISEVSRVATIVPTGVPHASSRDTTLRGYEIPKGTMVLPNQWAVHNDPALWGDPQNFRPERFLDNRGVFKEPEYFIPFSVGPRVCMGENLARLQLFVFMTCLLQKLEFSLHPDDEEPSFELEDAMVCRPKPFHVLVTSRQQ